MISALRQIQSLPRDRNAGVSHSSLQLYLVCARLLLICYRPGAELASLSDRAIRAVMIVAALYQSAS